MSDMASQQRIKRDGSPQREQHGACQRCNCHAMARRFKAEGRRVKLTAIERNMLGTGGCLKWICVFDGPDADPGHYRHYDENWSSKR